MTAHETAEDTWDDVRTRVLAWIDDDPDPQTADELRTLLARADGDVRDDGTGSGPRVLGGSGSVADERVAAAPREVDEAFAATERDRARTDLADRFSGLLQFGTAGLRGELGGGPARMNRAVVIRAAAGLGSYLTDALAGVGAPRVIVGYDARYGSHVFALDTAAVLTAAGAQVLLLPSPLPTPVLAFAVRHLDADAGVMVTASHNPPRDNGYKVYLGGRVVADGGQGAQIVPPADEQIAARIAAVPSVAAVPRADEGWTVLGTDVVDAYVDAVVSRDRAADTGPTGLRIVLTPLHGVGGAVAQRVLAEAGFVDVLLVPEQADPDPDFPTVSFPNPEEPGALDLALGLACDENADLVLALDPDADRCAVAVLDPRTGSYRGPETAASDGWRRLHGDETGALLGAEAAARATLAAAGEGPVPVLASSIVSSRLLSRIAAEAGLRHEQTLTGFKWISRVEGLAFGYEEALGYCVDPEHVRDKDGISAALAVARLAARLAAEGRTLLDALDDLARRHGLYLTDQVAARFADLTQISRTVDRLREHPPTTLGGSPVVEVVDLATGSDTDRGGLPPTEGLRLVAADGTRVVVRPSGTEPKVKCYLEVVEPVAADTDDRAVAAARDAARHRLDAVADDVTAALGL